MADDKPKKSKIEKLIPIEKPETPKEKKAVDLNKLANKLNTKFGLDDKQKIIYARDVKRVEVFPTNILRVDYSLQIGGIPRGRINMVSGKEQSWKSTLTLKTIASAQAMGGQAAYVDAERTFEPNWAKRHNVDLDKLLVYPTQYQEQALDVITQLIEAGVDIIVVDSLVAMASLKEMHDAKKNDVASVQTEAMGLFQRKMSQWLRTATPRVADNDTCLIFINQLRSNISGYGNPESIPGGRAIRFYDTVELMMRKLTSQADKIIDKKTGNEIGAKYQYRVDKNKLAQPGMEGTFVAYGEMVDNINSVFDIAVAEKIIGHPNNTTYEYDGTKWIGRQKCITAIATVPGLFNSLEKSVRESMANITPQPYDPYAIVAEAPEDLGEFVEPEETEE